MILLDTHVLIWWIDGGERLSAPAMSAIEEDGPVLVSPVSFWELAVLVERGRVAVDRDLAHWCRDLLTSGTAQVAALTPLAAISADRLPEFHGDPADRFIYATARELGAALVSKDAKMREYARRRGTVEVIW
ncbi:MAG TPA: type II toxin-antitoxin system VapC family toxin [Chloroflexota bacterium]|nr:type II toxin-antitoxin system VapC family toxin [Chloroflexota bacterium]